MFEEQEMASGDEDLEEYRDAWSLAPRVPYPFTHWCRGRSGSWGAENQCHSGKGQKICFLYAEEAFWWNQLTHLCRWQRRILEVISRVRVGIGVL